MKIEHPQYLGQVLLSKGFRIWFLYMFRVIEGNKFIEEPLHTNLFNCFDKVYNQELIRLILNLPPRSGKTTLIKYFIVYSLTQNPKSNFIYTSYSQSLVSQISQHIKDILENPIYKAMYPSNIDYQEEKTELIDEFWKEYLFNQEKKTTTYTNKKIITNQGGELLFSSIGSQITGFGCFSYNTLVSTDNGFMKLGDIVKNKNKCKIKSYNFKTKEIEYKEIVNYIENKNNEFLEITLNNGEVIETTLGHLFYDKNGQTIFAKDLNVGAELFSDFFNNEIFNIKIIANFFNRVISITNKGYLFLSKDIFSNSFFPLSSSLKSNPIGLFFPINPTFNIRDIISSKIILFCNFCIWSYIFCYFYCLTFRYFSIPVMCSVFDTILFVVGLSTIFQIIYIVINRISVNMSNNHSFFLFSYKSPSNKLMNSTFFFNRINGKVYTFISFFRNIKFQNFITFLGEYISIFGNKIIRKIRNRKKIIITNINKIHNASSYCLSIKDNNNLFVGNSQILVHNCGTRTSSKFSGFLAIDDGNKPADIRSETLREKTKIYFEETLLSRLNNSNIPIINIQQRLHLDDISGFLLDKYNFNIIKAPLINEDGTCNLPSQYTQERIDELQKNESMFSAQYQQEPVEDGGNLFKIDWFKFVDEIPNESDFDYRFITADIAYKDKEQNDFTVFAYWGVKTIEKIKRLYLIDMQRAKMQAVDIERWIDNWIKIKQTYRFRYSWIEDKAHGIYLNQAFRNKRYNIPTEEQIKETLPRERDKVERANNILPYIDRIVSNIYINSKINCIDDFKKEVLAFPNGKHDDIVDCTVDAIKIAFAGNDIVEMYKNIYGD